ncbi:MAG: 50S ribosomal protein L29 [Patescibacteria group bacterium]|nr:50S ribosomal protein L29 [Patescibacteria group bacterium]
MDFKDLKNKSANELQRMLAEERGRLYDLRLKLAVNQLKNTRQVREVRTSIAQILTQLTDLKLKETLSKES